MLVVLFSRVSLYGLYPQAFIESDLSLLSIVKSPSLLLFILLLESLTVAFAIGKEFVLSTIAPLKEAKRVVLSRNDINMECFK